MGREIACREFVLTDMNVYRFGAPVGLGLNEVVLCRKVPLSEGRVEEGELQVRAQP